MSESKKDRKTTKIAGITPDDLLATLQGKASKETLAKIDAARETPEFKALLTSLERFFADLTDPETFKWETAIPHPRRHRRIPRPKNSDERSPG